MIRLCGYCSARNVASDFCKEGYLQSVTDSKACSMTKLVHYKHGRFVCNTPPVCTAKWEDADWVKYIDSEGTWI